MVVPRFQSLLPVAALASVLIVPLETALFWAYSLWSRRAPVLLDLYSAAAFVAVLSMAFGCGSRNELLLKNIPFSLFPMAAGALCATGECVIRKLPRVWLAASGGAVMCSLLAYILLVFVRLLFRD